MEISQKDFFVLLLYSLMCGALLGAVYEIFRTIRIAFMLALMPSAAPSCRIFRKKLSPYSKKNEKSKPISGIIIWTVTFLCDIIYMLVWAVTVIAVSYALNGGRIRWMVYIGLLMGFAMYRLTFGKMISEMLSATMIVMNNLMRKITRRCIDIVGRMLKKLKSIPVCKKRRRKEKQGGKTCCE